jgi:rhamnosyltransferase
MKISVIIPTLNAGNNIDRLLNRLFNQTLLPYEIIIIDSSSKDNTVQIAEKMGARVLEIPRKHFNHGETRNMGAFNSKGEILMFMTQDAIPADNYLIEKLVSPLDSDNIAASYARHLPNENATPIERFARLFNYPQKECIKGKDSIQALGIKTFFFSNVCSVIKKNIFINVGAFPRVKANEDMIFTAKLILNGFKIAYVPDAKVIHSHNYLLLKQFIRYYNIGSSFKNNKWILSLTKLQEEGIKFLKEELAFLKENHKYYWIPYAIIDAIIRYLGYRLGFIIG